MEGKDSEIKKLNAHLRCNEEELSKVRRQFDECTKECNRISEKNRMLEMDLKCTKAKLADEKLCTQRMEENFKLEREMLSEELKIKCKKLSDMEAQYEEANRKVNEGKCKIKLLTNSLQELKDISERNQCELKRQVQKLKEENISKDDDICHLKKKIKELQMELYGNKCSGKCDNSRECD